MDQRHKNFEMMRNGKSSSLPKPGSAVMEFPFPLLVASGPGAVREGLESEGTPMLKHGRAGAEPVRGPDGIGLLNLPLSRNISPQGPQMPRGPALSFYSWRNMPGAGEGPLSPAPSPPPPALSPPGSS